MPKSKPLTLPELKALLPRIQATVEALVGRGRGAAASSGRALAGHHASRGRAGAERLQEKLIAALKGKKGLQLKEIVKRVGADSGAVQYHLRKLRSQKRARVVGDRKEARWFA
jgi:hypothetical protein